MVGVVIDVSERARRIAGKIQEEGLIPTLVVAAIALNRVSTVHAMHLTSSADTHKYSGGGVVPCIIAGCI